MKLLLALLFSLLPLTLLAQNSDSDFINKTLYPATALLYAQSPLGDLNMICTATAYEYKDGTYSFVAAAHCTSEDDEDKGLSVPTKTYFFISPDNPGAKDFYRAEVLASGFQKRGDDFTILQLKTDHKFPIIPLGEDSTTYGDPIVNVASPMGLGRQVLYGNISNPKLDRPLVDSDSSINWENSVVLQLPNTAGGSSGSSIICLNQKAICGILVGTVGKAATIAVPVSKFKKFKDQVEKGTYKYFKASEE